MSKPNASIQIGDRLCFIRKVVPKNEKSSAILTVTDIQVEYKACAFKGTRNGTYCPCSAVCDAFEGKVLLENESAPEDTQTFEIRSLIRLLRDEHIWHVDSQELFDYAGINVEPGGAQ